MLKLRRWFALSGLLFLPGTHPALALKIDRNDTHINRSEAYEKTLAYTLLNMEYQYTSRCNVANDQPSLPDYQALFNLYSIAGERLENFGVSDWPTTTEETAVSALTEIDKVLGESGFVTCIEVARLSQTFSAPFFIEKGSSKIDLGNENSCSVFVLFPEYRYQYALKHVDTGFRPIDCDLGSILYISIGELNGLPLTFVETPNHNFVRWSFSDGTYINWDYNDAETYTDDDYRAAKPKSLASHRAFNLETEKKNRYLVDRSHDEIVAYYIGLFSDDIQKKECVIDLFEKTMNASWVSPDILNNFAWIFSTNSAFKNPVYTSKAVETAEQAIQLRPECYIWDTVSCAYASTGEFERAAQIEETEISVDSKKIQFFREGRDCYEREVQEAAHCAD